MVPALGVAQIIAWGSLYYSIAVLVAPMQVDLGFSQPFIFGAFTVALVVSGLAAPTTGRLIDRYGGRPVLAVGSGLAAAALLLIAIANGPVLFVAGWFIAGLAMAACLYDAAFGALHQFAGAYYRRALTAITLFGGLASTVFWPLSHFLGQYLDWRETLMLYAALHVFICLPLHFYVVPRASGGPMAAPETAADPPQPVAAPNILWLVSAFASVAFVFSALSVHLVQILKQSGFSATDAIVIAACIGPMQVAGRVVEFALARRVHPFTVGTWSFSMMFAALVALCFAEGPAAVAFVFAGLYGASNGIMTIVRGTVPAELFGRADYAALLGRLARPTFIAKAVAPVVFSLLITAGLSERGGVIALAICAAIALVSYQVALSRAARTSAAQPSNG